MAIQEEPPDSAVLFVDMLGFAALVLETPDAIGKLRPIFEPITPLRALAQKIMASQDGLLVERFTRFHIGLERRIRHDVHSGITAITFSDSAFIHVPRPVRAVAFARALMREMITNRVPVRMGIGAGSFAALRFLSDNTSHAHVHSTQFLGTAVVRAYLAEKCGIEGMRILLHPSVQPMLKGEVSNKAIVRLEETKPDAYAEVNYVYMSSKDEGLAGPKAVEARYLHYVEAVDTMAQSAPPSKLHYYKNTVKALKRMKTQLV
jgi:hypothetical protein